jgi:hypothetical protein
MHFPGACVSRRHAPIQYYPRFVEEKSMINRLPDVCKMGGIILCKDGHPPDDWFFRIQYSDKDNNLQEIKVPLLDGLYLLNLLREVEKDQQLELWDRNKLTA